MTHIDHTHGTHIDRETHCICSVSVYVLATCLFDGSMSCKLVCKLCHVCSVGMSCMSCRYVIYAMWMRVWICVHVLIDIEK